jgi:hypothetical protein
MAAGKEERFAFAQWETNRRRVHSPQRFPVLASTAGQDTAAKIAEADVFASTAYTSITAKIAGAMVFASTTGKDPSARIANRVFPKRSYSVVLASG